LLIFFFFSSRRRHTRFSRDWSSDVCSSDLKTAVLSTGVRNVAWRVAERQEDGSLRFELAPLALGPRIEDEGGNDVYIVRAGLARSEERRVGKECRARGSPAQ